MREVRVGLLNFEPIRVTGLCELLPAAGFRTSAITLPELLRDAGFDLLLIALRDLDIICELVSGLRSRHPHLRTLVIGSHLDDDSVIALITSGAKGWLEDTAAPEQILHALQVVLRGSIWAPRRILSLLVDRALEVGPARLRSSREARFTGREQEILSQLVLARSNREIAQALSIREQTVKSYIARMMRKAGVGNRIALSLRAARIGDPDDQA